jgi:hypothetical protein
MGVASLKSCLKVPWISLHTFHFHFSVLTNNNESIGIDEVRTLRMNGTTIPINTC